MSARPANTSLRAPRSLEQKAKQAVERAITREGCDRVLLVYEQADVASRSAAAVRVYGEDASGTHRKLEVLR